MMLRMTLSRLLCRNQSFKSISTFPIRFASPAAEVDEATTSDPSPPPLKIKSKPKKPSKTKLKNSQSQELLSFISESVGPLEPNALKLLPTKCSRIATSIPTALYLIDKPVASQITELIRSDKPDLEAPAIEYCSGFGTLTSNLIQLGFKNLTCFEEQAKLAKILGEKFDVTVIQKSFNDLPRLHHIDKVDGGNRVLTLLSQVKVPKGSDSDPELSKKKNLHVFGSFPHISSINFLIKNLVTQKLLYEDDWGWDDPIYYVALGSKAYWILSSTPTSGYFTYRPSAILFQLLFKSRLLGTVPRKAFIPWANESVEGKSVKFKVKNEYDPDLVYILKIETNQDLVNKLGRDQLFQFWYFVRQHLYSRKRPIIPQLEQWIPGCGSKLIRKGFTIYSQFGELTPQQILNIYLEFVSWPEFSGSSFLTAVEKFQSRIEAHEEDEMDFRKT